MQQWNRDQQGLNFTGTAGICRWFTYRAGIISSVGQCPIYSVMLSYIIIDHGSWYWSLETTAHRWPASDLTSCFAPAPIKFRGREYLPWRPNTFSQSAKQNTWRHNFRRETREYSCLIFVIESICSITPLPVVSTVHTSWLPLIASGDQQLPSINYVAIPDWPGYVTTHATVPDWLRLHFNVRKSIREARGQSWSVMRGQNVRSCDQDGLQARPIVTWADI